MKVPLLKKVVNRIKDIDLRSISFFMYGTASSTFLTRLVLFVKQVCIEFGDIGEAAVILGEVETVADDEAVGDSE